MEGTSNGVDDGAYDDDEEDDDGVNGWCMMEGIYHYFIPHTLHPY